MSRPQGQPSRRRQRRAGPARRRRRFALLYVAPTLALLGVAALPLAGGDRTLYLRDVFNTHLEMKWVQAAAWRSGEPALVDPYRDGGQPLLGNPNSVPLYPDNLLYLVASPFWALNAHFWLHLLLAPFSAFWLARAWGLSREAAWAAGVCYAGSGYFLSSLNLYNLVAGAALAPALAAAALGAGGARGRGWRRGWAALAVLWALMLLGGDPMTAVVALVLALSAAAARHGWRRAGWSRLAAGTMVGTLVAVPQIVEFARILPLSFRAVAGYSPAAATAASWPPAAAAEWLLPFLFGRPDLGFWGWRQHGGDLPLFLTLYPGLLALVLVAAAGRPRVRAAAWAWVVAAAGLFLALGRHNPAVGWLLALPGADLLRLPVKFWPLVAVGGSLLCGLGFQRLLRGPGRRPLGRALGLLAVLYAVAWLALTLAPAAAEEALGPWLPAGAAPGLAAAERLRWAGLCLISLAALGVLAIVVRLGAGRRTGLRGGRLGSPALAALLPVHLGLQLFLLRPVLATDELAPYLEPPALLAAVPASALVAHGPASGLFGSVRLPAAGQPDARLLWLERRAFAELHPAAGILWGRRYAFHPSPEGLDAFLTRATAQSFAALDDAARLRLLAASGVDLLLLDRELEASTADLARLEHVHQPPDGDPILVYRLPAALPEVHFVGEVLRAPHLNAALTWITAPGFDPWTTAVFPVSGQKNESESKTGRGLTGGCGEVAAPPVGEGVFQVEPGGAGAPGARPAQAVAPDDISTVEGLSGAGSPGPGPAGEVRVLASGTTDLELEVVADRPGALVVQRAFLGTYRAMVNGRPAPLEAANIHRLGLSLSAGTHQVRIWIDRRPLAAASVVSLLALATLLAIAVRPRRGPLDKPTAPLT